MTLKVALQQERITANIKGQNYSWKIEWKLFKSTLMSINDRASKMSACRSNYLCGAKVHLDEAHTHVHLTPGRHHAGAERVIEVICRTDISAFKRLSLSRWLEKRTVWLFSHQVSYIQQQRAFSSLDTVFTSVLFCLDFNSTTEMENTS